MNKSLERTGSPWRKYAFLSTVCKLHVQPILLHVITIITLRKMYELWRSSLRNLCRFSRLFRPSTHVPASASLLHFTHEDKHTHTQQELQIVYTMWRISALPRLSFAFKKTYVTPTKKIRPSQRRLACYSSKAQQNRVPILYTEFYPSLTINVLSPGKLSFMPLNKALLYYAYCQ